VNSQAHPLIVEWPSPDRLQLENKVRQGLVVVRYVGCEMTVLERCTVPGTYGYLGGTLAQDELDIDDADDLYANLPVGAARLEGKLQRSGSLSVKMSLVGRYESPRPTVRVDELQGVCDGATHFVCGVTVGAFDFSAGGKAAVGGGAGVAGIGAGAQSQAARETLTRDGDPSACSKSTPDDKAPPSQCGALIRLEVVPLGQAVAPTPTLAAVQPAPTTLAAPSPPPPRPSAAPSADDGAVVRVPLGSSPVRGSPNALVTLVEFADFQCPFCGRAQATLQALRERYGGALRIVWKNEPLAFHTAAEPAAEAALEVRAQLGDPGFWAMHDRLFAGQKDLSIDALARMAGEVGASPDRVRRAVGARSHAPEIATDQSEAADVQAVGTPFFFVNGRRLAGAQPLEKFEAVIDEEMTRARAALAAGTPQASLYDVLTTARR
jgi:protein-disulfide isomerase